jgi:predicted RecA/RadA family phage recombinase
MSQTFRQEAHEPVQFTAPEGGVTNEEPVVINGFVVLPLTDADEGETFAGRLGAIHRLPKATGFAPAQGDIAYQDLGADARLESTGYPIGRYLAAAGSSDTTALVFVTAELNLQAFGPQLLEFTLQPPSGVAASRDFIFTAPDAGELEELELFTSERPGSSLGTVVETVTNLTGTVNMLDATNIELEAGITNGTPLLPTLSATPANKRFARGDRIRFRITSTNADVVAGAGIAHRVKWRRRVA